MAEAQLVGGVWLPADERHLVEWMLRGPRAEPRDGKATYQIHKLDLAMQYVQADRRRVAVDVGAHCGLWSMWLTRLFDRVEAFEPVALHADLFERNVDGDYALHRTALGARDGRVRMARGPASSGDTYVAGDGDDVPIRTLDGFALDCVDFVKIDVEGYELPVVEGACETLKRCRPAIIVEQKGWNETHTRNGNRDALRYVEALGYVQRAQCSGDFVLTHRDAN